MARAHPDQPAATRIANLQIGGLRDMQATDDSRVRVRKRKAAAVAVQVPKLRETAALNCRTGQIVVKPVPLPGVPHPQAGQRVGFTVLGPPQPWQRAGTTRKGIRYTQKETLQYERAIKTAAFCAGLGVDRGILPSGYALSLNDPKPSWPKDARYLLIVQAYFANARRRDLDNVLKACGDALNGIAYEDDSQIDSMSIARGYDAMTPRTEITIEVLP